MIETRRSTGHGTGRTHNAAQGRGGAAATGHRLDVGRVLERVSREVGADGYSRYFEHQTRVLYDNGRLDVTVPTGFVAELIGKRFGPSLLRAVREELGLAPGQRDVELNFRVDHSAFEARPARPGQATPPRQPHPPAAPRVVEHRRHASCLPIRLGLDDFVVGEANRLAFTAAERIAGADCPRSFSPLFVHGACGLGKTHLLQGIAHRHRERNPGQAIVYTTAEAFTNEYISAVRAGRLDTFRRSYRAIRLLCIDDVQFLANKQATQAELLHTFDAIDLGGARVVLASDEHPRQVRKFSAALVSRFMAGMVVRLDPPDPALRARIVAALAQRRGLTLDEPAAALISSRCGAPGEPCSVRDIEGVLTRIEALRRLHPELSPAGAPGLVLVGKALGVTGGGTPTTRRPVRAQRIIEEVCRTLHVEHAELVGKGRHKRVVLARAISSHLCRAMTTMSFPEIARALGRPNHSTVITACKRLQTQLKSAEPPDLGPEPMPEIRGLTIEAIIAQVRDDITRSGPGA